MKEEKRCGQCEGWDEKRVDGKPVGLITRKDGTSEKGGFCRKKGLIYRDRGENDICKQPEHFRPRKTN